MAGKSTRARATDLHRSAARSAVGLCGQRSLTGLRSTAGQRAAQPPAGSSLSLCCDRLRKARAHGPDRRHPGRVVRARAATAASGLRLLKARARKALGTIFAPELIRPRPPGDTGERPLGPSGDGHHHAHSAPGDMRNPCRLPVRLSPCRGQVQPLAPQGLHRGIEDTLIAIARQVDQQDNVLYGISRIAKRVGLAEAAPADRQCQTGGSHDVDQLGGQGSLSRSSATSAWLTTM
jgi:hypothetical protein